MIRRSSLRMNPFLKCGPACTTLYIRGVHFGSTEICTKMPFRSVVQNRSSNHFITAQRFNIKTHEAGIQGTPPGETPYTGWLSISMVMISVRGMQYVDTGARLTPFFLTSSWRILNARSKTYQLHKYTQNSLPWLSEASYWMQWSEVKWTITTGLSIEPEREQGDDGGGERQRRRRLSERSCSRLKCFFPPIPANT